MLLLVSLAKNPPHRLMDVHLCFWPSSLPLLTLLLSYCALDLYVYLCWILMLCCIHPNMLYLIHYCFIDFF
jgi:hypothetical protein